MHFTSLNEVFGTLRFRLTVWNTLVVLLVVGLTLLGVREGIRLTLQHQADELLRQDLKEVGLTLKQPAEQGSLARGTLATPVSDELNRMVEAHHARGLFVHIFDARGRVRWASSRPPEMDLSSIPEIKYNVPSSFGKYRIMRARLSSSPDLTVVIGTIPEFSEAELKRLTQIMLAAGLIVLLVAPLGGYLLALRATKPLARIIDTTARLHPSCLTERLPLRGSGDELDQLSLTINGFLDRLNRYISQNREFTANAAHELRSPLAAIQSSLDVALNAERSVDEYKEMLGVVLEQCGNLAVLINQLLLLAESDAGRLPWDADPVRLDQIVVKAVDMFEGVAESAGISLLGPKPGPVVVDGNSNRLRQVVNNLIDNAIKFTPAKGKVTVELTQADGHGEVELRVSDTGPGILAHDLPHIFDRFYRGDKSRRREPNTRGSGLGLAICRSIIVNHGGNIVVDSKVGAGSTFIVRLPSPKLPRRPGRHDPISATPTLELATE